MDTVKRVLLIWIVVVALAASTPHAQVTPIPANSVTAGTLSATTTPAAIGSGAIQKVLIQSDPDNTVDILCGNASTQPIQLSPGDGFSMDVTNLNLVSCKTVSGTGTVGYVAR